MGNVIVIEGCDKTGKSSTAQMLAGILGWKIVASGPPRTDDPAAEYLAVLDEHHDGLILDRFHLGELIYGPLYRGSQTSPFDLARVEDRLRARGALLVHLTDTPDAIAHRFVEDKEAFASLYHIPQIVDGFHRVVGWSTLEKLTLVYDKVWPRDQAEKIAAAARAVPARGFAMATSDTFARLIDDNGAGLYRRLLQQIIDAGAPVEPRGMPTLELAPAWLTLTDPRRSVIATPARKLSQRFAAAEFAWIMSGECRLDGIEDYMPRLAQYADQGIDGRAFFGAYGPPIMGQIDYVLYKLDEDRDTRQAVITIWRQNPPETKDVPCTVMLHYYVRGGCLHALTYMRSNDAWLGFPYDLQTFTRLQMWIASAMKLGLGYYHHVVGSMHLYHSTLADAALVMVSEPVEGPRLAEFKPAAPGQIWEERHERTHLARDDEWGRIARLIEPR
jgi:thymidylate synthase